MRPTVQEQLDQATRLLEAIVAPAVTDAPPLIILNGIIENLKLLGQAVTKIPDFLTWDNNAMRDLLSQPGFEEDASDPDPHETPAIDPVWMDDAERENERLRQRLARIVRGTGAGDSRVDAIRQHLIARASRFPLRAIPSTPGTVARAS